MFVLQSMDFNWNDLFVLIFLFWLELLPGLKLKWIFKLFLLLLFIFVITRYFASFNCARCCFHSLQRCFFAFFYYSKSSGVVQSVKCWAYLKCKQNEAHFTCMRLFVPFSARICVLFVHIRWWAGWHFLSSYTTAQMSCTQTEIDSRWWLNVDLYYL